MAVRAWTVLLLVTFADSAAAADADFQQRPTAMAAADGVHIRFALSRPADAEVAVLDARGRIVRHLAAGVLGGGSPPPSPLQPGLRQQLAWDGKNDWGQPAGGGPFRVRVRTGMTANFGRILGASPYTGNVTDTPYRAPVNGLVTDGQGQLYVKLMSSVGSHGNSGLWPWHLRKFDKTGRYLKTLLPYPPSTNPMHASGFTLVDAGDGAFTPANQNSLYPVFYVFGDEIVNRLIDGQIVFVNSRTRELNFFRVDGSNALRTVRMWSDKDQLRLPSWLAIQVAISPDGRYAYYSNAAGTAYDGKTPADIDPRWPQGRIYRHDLSRADVGPERFFDLTLPDFRQQKYWMPSAWDKKTAAAGIDVDGQGNVLVGDLVNQAVVEISPEGRLLTTTPVTWPDRVLVSRRSGALYAISRPVSRGALPPAELVKITGRGAAARIASRIALEGSVGGACALDESGPVPVLWLAGGGALIRVEDRGHELAVTGTDFLQRDPNAITFVGYMDVDPEAELVYVTRTRETVWRFQGDTGAGGPLPIKAVDLAVGPGGMVYTWGVDGGYAGPLARFTRQLKPAPLPASGVHTYGRVSGRAGRGCAVGGLDVDSRGRVYVADGVNVCHVRVYDADGQLVQSPHKIKSDDPQQRGELPAAVDHVSGYGGSLRVDPAGNIYLLQYGVPKGHKPPPGYADDEAYRAMVGTILKFSPEGAKRRTPLQEGGRGGDPLAYEGTLGMYPGCAPISGWRCDGACACTKPRFDVDAYGRLYIPNGVTFSVSVRDNAGNEIARFGHYGNFDAQGPSSAEPQPDIPLGWPVAVGASDRAIYVGDCLNHRVVRVDKTFAAEATCDVPPGGH
jgi:sugar lactone lactonase YvrE